MAKEKSKRELSEIKRAEDASKLVDEVWVTIQTATQYVSDPDIPIRDMELAIQKSNELLSKLEAEFKVISQYETKRAGTDKVYEFLQFEPRMEIEGLEDTLAERKMREEKKQIDTSEALSDEASSASERESSASDEPKSFVSTTSDEKKVLPRSGSTYFIMPTEKDAVPVLDEKTNKEIEDELKQSSPRTFTQVKVKPEASKPEASKPGILTRIMNGIRDLFKSDNKNKTGSSMSKIIDSTRGNRSVAEMITNREETKRVEKVDESKKASEAKKPPTVTQQMKDYPPSKWDKDEDKAKKAFKESLSSDGTSGPRPHR